MSKSTVASGVLLLGLVTGMLSASPVQADTPPTQAACVITADTPYARNNLVWTGGVWSGCAAPVEVDLKWSRTGPDGTIGVKTSAVSGYDYAWECRWGTPQNRILYGKAFDNNGVGDESSLRGFTSANTNCVL